MTQCDAAGRIPAAEVAVGKNRKEQEAPGRHGHHGPKQDSKKLGHRRTRSLKHQVCQAGSEPPSFTFSGFPGCPA